MHIAYVYCIHFHKYIARYFLLFSYTSLDFTNFFLGLLQNVVYPYMGLYSNYYSMRWWKKLIDDGCLMSFLETFCLSLFLYTHTHTDADTHIQTLETFCLSLFLYTHTHTDTDTHIQTQTHTPREAAGINK